MNWKLPRNTGRFSIPSPPDRGASFHSLDSEFQTFPTKLGDTTDSPRIEAAVTRYSLEDLRQRYVIKAGLLKRALRKS